MENPNVIMKNSIDYLTFKIKGVCNLLNVDYEYFENWIKMNKQDEYQKNIELFQALNYNIYGKYKENKLLEFELQAWKNVVDKWKKSYLKLLAGFWKSNYKQVA